MSLYDHISNLISTIQAQVREPTYNATNGIKRCWSTNQLKNNLKKKIN